jgi:hypothetical protein
VGEGGERGSVREVRAHHLVSELAAEQNRSMRQVLAARPVLAPVPSTRAHSTPTAHSRASALRPAALAKPSLAQSLARRRVLRVQKRTVPCAVSTPLAAMAMKTYTYTELTDAERDAVCARPRIDFTSIMDIVRHAPSPWCMEPAVYSCPPAHCPPPCAAHMNHILRHVSPGCVR